MKKQMRKVGILLVTALSASLLAGCGFKFEKQKETTAKQTATAETKTEASSIEASKSEAASDKKEEVTITVFAGGTDHRVPENARECNHSGKLRQFWNADDTN